VTLGRFQSAGVLRALDLQAKPQSNNIALRLIELVNPEPERVLDPLGVSPLATQHSPDVEKAAEVIDTSSVKPATMERS
jgi:hypothetical protein